MESLGGAMGVTLYMKEKPFFLRTVCIRTVLLKRHTKEPLKRPLELES
jgi:hypothetical protein